MTVIAFLFHYYKHDNISFCLLKIFPITKKRPLQRDIDTAMTMNINSVDGDSIKFNWATNKIYVKHRWVLQKV